MKNSPFILLLLIALFPGFAGGIVIDATADTLKINKIVEQLNSSRLPLGDKIASAANSLVDTVLDDYYTTDSVASLRLNIDSFTPLMFVNYSIALAKASGNPVVHDWHTVISELENIACRRGEDNGFSSIMFHTSDWIGDNVARGNIQELTENYSGVVARTKSLDEMTRNRHKYAALSDSSVFESIRMTEMGFRTHRIPSLKKETIKKKELTDDLKNGDILVLVPNKDGIDYYDIGIISITDDGPKLIHMSPSAHKVVVEKDDLQRYMALVTKYFQGYRILRLKD